MSNLDGQDGWGTQPTPKALGVTDGGKDYIAITDTALHGVQGARVNRLSRIINGGVGTGQSNALNVYDCQNPASPQASELIYTALLGLQESRSVQLPIKYRLAVQMAGAVTANTVVLVQWE